MAKQSSTVSKTKKKSKKGSKKSGPDAVAMKLKASKPNPFETIWSRRKFDILGKKRKGEERRIGLARSLAIQKRKKTLLKEYEQSNKSSVFVDKRIGEQNETLGEFDKAIMRSQRERQLALSKKSKYNLSDGEEDDYEFPGLGPLPERDDFEDEMLSDDDNDDGDGGKRNSTILKSLNSQEVKNPSEGELVEGEENKHKSKKEIMEEVILKSKYFKAQKAKDKEENEQLMEELDKSFSSLVQSQKLVSLTEPRKMNALRALVNKDLPSEQLKKDNIPVTQNAETYKQDQPDSYDKLVNEMILDMRARPSDRTKTPEEIAQEERERLEQLEEERQKRMLTTDDSSDDDGENVEKESTQRPRSISGDDLGDSFSVDEDIGAKKGWVDEILGRKSAEDSESEDDEDGSEDLEGSEDSEGSEDDVDEEGFEENDDDRERTLSLKDWEQSDDDNLDTDFEEDEEGDQGHDEATDHQEDVEQRHSKKPKNIDVRKEERKSSDAKIMKAKNKDSTTQQNIPFIIEAPKSLEELSALVENYSNADVIVVINRIRASNAIKLAAENRKKMQVFYGVLLQYFAILADKKPLNFELLNLLVKPLMEMSTEVPYFAAICARQRILQTRTKFCEAIKNSESGCWPNMKTLFLLRLWSMIFPCSDFRHAVMTPAILLMSEYLMRCRVLSGRDVAVGSFLCSMVLAVAKQSQKFCPEAIMFLRTLLMATTEQKPASDQDYQLMELKALRPLLHIHGSVSEINPLNFLMVMNMPEDSAFFSSDNFRASTLVTIIETLRGFVDIYDKLSSFPEIFLPISTLLHDISHDENMPEALKVKFKDVADSIKKKADEFYALRRPLQMRKQKPVPIKLVNPKFEENFVKGRDYDPDRERAERRKLQKQIKREAKGAARELRKDNYFLYEVKQRDKVLVEEERAEKYGKARAFLQEQENAFKSGQLGKGRKRRR
ncbi:hypothetical protein SLA2020_036780 [Shorea laevis]